MALLAFRNKNSTDALRPRTVLREVTDYRGNIAERIRQFFEFNRRLSDMRDYKMLLAVHKHVTSRATAPRLSEREPFNFDRIFDLSEFVEAEAKRDSHLALFRASYCLKQAEATKNFVAKKSSDSVVLLPTKSLLVQELERERDALAHACRVRDFDKWKEKQPPAPNGRLSKLALRKAELERTAKYLEFFCDFRLHDILERGRTDDHDHLLYSLRHEIQTINIRIGRIAGQGKKHGVIL